MAEAATMEAAPAAAPDDEDRFMRLDEVERTTALSRSAIYRRMDAGTFPEPRDLGGGVIRWVEGDVKEWKRARPVATRRARVSEDR